MEKWEGKYQVWEERDQGGDEDGGGGGHPPGAAHQDVAGRRQEGLDVEDAACCGVETESHHRAREAVLVTIPGHKPFETLLKRKYLSKLRASYEVVCIEWLHNSVVYDVDTGEEEDDDGGHLSPQLPVGYQHREGDDVGEEAEDGQGNTQPSRGLVAV